MISYGQIGAKYALDLKSSKTAPDRTMPDQADVVNFADYRRKSPHGIARKRNENADRAFWKGGPEDSLADAVRFARTMAAGKKCADMNCTYDGSLCHGKGCLFCNPEDLSMGQADPEIIEADRGDCA